MAKATKNSVVTTVVLELSEDEALVIRDVLWRVGGDPKTTRRGLSASVLDALTGVLGQPQYGVSTKDMASSSRICFTGAARDSR